jgi:hypothetical protein
MIVLVHKFDQYSKHMTRTRVRSFETEENAPSAFDLAWKDIQDRSQESCCYSKITKGAVVVIYMVMGLALTLGFSFGILVPALDKYNSYQQYSCQILTFNSSQSECQRKMNCACDSPVPISCADRLENKTDGLCWDSQTPCCLQQTCSRGKRPKRCNVKRCSGVGWDRTCTNPLVCCSGNCIEGQYGIRVCDILTASCWNGTYGFRVGTVKEIIQRNWSCGWNEESCFRKQESSFVPGTNRSCWVRDDVFEKATFLEPKYPIGAWVLVGFGLIFVLISIVVALRLCCHFCSKYSDYKKELEE